MLEFRQDVPDSIKSRVKDPDRLIKSKDLLVWSDVLMLSELSLPAIHDNITNSLRQQSRDLARHMYLPHLYIVDRAAMQAFRDIYAPYSRLAGNKIIYLFADNDSRTRVLLRFQHVFYAEMLDFVEQHVYEIVGEKFFNRCLMSGIELLTRLWRHLTRGV